MFPYKLHLFSEVTRETIARICQALFYNYELVVDDIALGFLLMLNIIIHGSLVKLDIVSFLVEIIHGQLKNFSSLITILYHKKEFFDKSNLKMPSVQPSNEAFLEFYSVVMPRVQSLLFENLPPRVFHECKSMLK